MASEPNPKIEELLQDYTKKRREQAGAPFELHSATRNLLQAEVTRQHDKPTERKSSWLGTFMLHWPRFALAGSVVVIALAGVLLWSEGRQSKRKDFQLALGKEVHLQPEIPTVPAPARDEKSEELGRATTTAAGPQPEADAARFDDALKPAVASADASRLRSLADDNTRKKASNLNAGKNSAEADVASLAVVANKLSESSPGVEQTSRGADLAKDKQSQGMVLNGIARSESTSGLNETLGERKLSQLPPPASTPTSALNSEARELSRSHPGLPPGTLAPALQPTAPQRDELDRFGAAPTQKVQERESLLRRQTETAARQLALAPENQPPPPTVLTATGATENRQQNLYSFQNNSSRQRWVQVPTPATRQQTADAKLSTILNSFEVEQTGNALRITEPDGSSYEGQILDMPLTKPAQQALPQLSARPPIAQPQRGAVVTPTDGAKNNVEQLQTLTDQNHLSGIQNVYFRVTGTNRSLKQPVVITGNFVVNNGQAFNNTLYFQNSPIPGTQQTDGAVGGIILPVDRMEGKALIGGAQEVLLNATPQTAP